MSTNRSLIPPHGGYRGLRAFHVAEAIYDGTVVFTRLYVDKRSRTVDQMVQAARSGKQNICEGSMASGTSKKTELKLIGVARSSLDELLQDYQDYLRQNGLEKWDVNHEKAVFIRKIGKRLAAESRGADQSDLPTPYSPYKRYIEDKGPANAANTLICLIHQANYLLDKLLASLEKEFVEEGGFTERLYRVRSTYRSTTVDHAD